MEIEDFNLPVTPQGEYPDETRVTLRGDRTGVYSLAKAGAEGWVRGRSYDPVGAYRMVYIEWDQEHWTYNNQDNAWAFEDHFELLNKDDEPVSDDAELRAALQLIASRLGKDDDKKSENVEDDLDLDLPTEQKTEKPEDDFEPVTDEEYTETLRNALRAAKGGESFLVIAVVREEHPASGDEVLVPKIYKADKDEEAAYLSGLFATQFGAMFHHDLTVDKTRTIRARLD